LSPVTGERGIDLREEVDDRQSLADLRLALDGLVHVPWLGLCYAHIRPGGHERTHHPPPRSCFAINKR
jgi:hypothetical protein